MSIEGTISIDRQPTDWVLYNRIIDLLRSSEPHFDGNYLPSLRQAESLLMHSTAKQHCALTLSLLSDGKPSDQAPRCPGIGQILMKLGYGGIPRTRMAIFRAPRLWTRGTPPRDVPMGALAVRHSSPRQARFADDDVHSSADLHSHAHSHTCINARPRTTRPMRPTAPSARSRSREFDGIARCARTLSSAKTAIRMTRTTLHPHLLTPYRVNVSYQGGASGLILRGGKTEPWKQA